jgi:hypothetical protein
MNMVGNKPSVRPLVLLALSLTLVSCNDVAGTFRQVTYPPGFTYVSREELSSRMHELGYELQQLDLALAPENQPLSEQQQQVVDILRNIERIAGGIQAGEAGSNHPFLQNDMAAFMATVAQARASAGLNPPRYYGAGQVSGGCTNCHQLNRG